MPEIKFDEVTHHVTKRVPCRVCGVKLGRATILSQTINPFNQGADGRPKTREQIRAELKKKAERWHPANDIHRACIATEQAASVTA